MKISAAVAALLAVSPLALAQVKGTDEQFYAVFVAALEQCQSAFPERKADYAKVRNSLGRMIQKNPRLSAVLQSPTLDTTLGAARSEMEKHLARVDKKAVCTDLRHGQFGQMTIPLEP